MSGTVRNDDWSISNAPAANAAATISKAAVGEKRHRCTSIRGSVSGVAAVASTLLVLRDGATGVGPILWQTYLAAAAGGAFSAEADNLQIIGSVNTAMTLEFTAAPGATNFEAVSLTGFTDY